MNGSKGEKIKLARKVADEISREEFELELSTVCQALNKCNAEAF